MSENPFIIDVAEILKGDGMPLHIVQSGPSPSRIGPAMIAIPEGQDVEVEATIVPLGSGVLVDATARAELLGQCVRCLKTLTPTETVRIQQVFATSDDFIGGDAEVEEDYGSGDEIMRVVDDKVDLEQAFVDEAGLTWPFNPTCQPECDGDTDVPAPDGVSGEEQDRVDPRWAGLEKFL
ncbi:DUF177 domain-containing protein [Corynebacterium aquatimens]|uniref:YceD family protein n=1 Tax=Corynebacterium TaxID=1716 RepID=UPI001F45002D|nr:MULTISPECIES: YceD family protein [Corynebacterium]QYH19530.1 DUF177 domain-containing protein [Corynebacterium aquatimens]UIZ91521.1 DUF177 domain-containing protein [Corynebacterium sp. CNCTC7651]